MDEWTNLPSCVPFLHHDASISYIHILPRIMTPRNLSISSSSPSLPRYFSLTTACQYHHRALQSQSPPVNLLSIHPPTTHARLPSTQRGPPLDASLPTTLPPPAAAPPSPSQALPNEPTHHPPLRCESCPRSTANRNEKPTPRTEARFKTRCRGPPPMQPMPCAPCRALKRRPAIGRRDPCTTLQGSLSQSVPRNAMRARDPLDPRP